MQQKVIEKLSHFVKQDKIKQIYTPEMPLRKISVRWYLKWLQKKYEYFVVFR